MGLIMHGALNAPYPDDPAEMGAVEWVQARSAMRDASAEIKRLRDAFTWSLRHTSGKELRRMVGDLQDTSDLDEFIDAIERAQSK